MKLNQIALAAALAFAAAGANAAILDSMAGSVNWKLVGVSAESTNYTDGTMETWAVGRITTIDDFDANALWTDGQQGDFLTYMLYGAVDMSITAGGFYGNNIYSTGATTGSGDGKIHLDIYRNDVAPTTITGLSLANRTGFGAFNGITNLTGSSLYLSLVLDAGVSLDDPSSVSVDESTSQLFQNANAQTLPATGKGTFYASAVGGTHKDKWNTDGFTTLLNTQSDFFGNFNLIPNVNNAAGANMFPGRIDDPVQSRAVPEPGTLALLGAALAGLGFTRRRKA